MTAIVGNEINIKSLRQQETKERLVMIGLTIPYLLIVILLIIVPIGWLFGTSFVDQDGSFTFKHYIRLVESKAYYRIFITTFEISIFTTLICILIGYPLTYFISQLPRRFANLCMIAVLIPFWTSLLVRTYAWLVLLQRKGLLNNFGIELGLLSEPLPLMHNMTGTLIGMVHIMLPFLILPLYANMRAIDTDYLKAASSMGANQLRAFWTIFFPLSVPGLLAGSLIVFVICLGFYVTPAVLGGGKVIMVSMKIQSNIELFFSWGAASALGVVLLVLTIAILYIASKFVSLDQMSSRG